MSIYVGANSAKKEAVSLYLGDGSTKKEITEAYYSESGTTRQVYASKAEPGQQVFTTSGTFTVPKGVKSVDVFLVGGGGAGGSYSGGSCGNGGGGGHTATFLNVGVTPETSYSVVIGAGGIAPIGDGGVSCAIYTSWMSASVGFQGGNSSTSVVYGDKDPGSPYAVGGSGGGLGQYGSSYYSGYGGQDGSNGYINNNYSLCQFAYMNHGQGSTTRAFGESSGTLYAGGGGGGSSQAGYVGIGGSGGGGLGAYTDWNCSAIAGVDNTGGGGGGGNSQYSQGANGGSGIVIIRWQ